MTQYEPKIVIGHVHSNVTYKLSGSNIDYIKKTASGTVIVTKDQGHICLALDRYVVNGEDFIVKDR